MLNIEVAKDIGERTATLQLAHGAVSSTLTAHVPGDINAHELAAVGSSALDLVRKLTGCNCLSGRIRFVVQDNFADVIKVDLNRLTHGV